MVDGRFDRRPQTADRRPLTTTGYSCSSPLVFAVISLQFLYPSFYQVVLHFGLLQLSFLFFPQSPALSFQQLFPLDGQFVCYLRMSSAFGEGIGSVHFIHGYSYSNPSGLGDLKTTKSH
jgi:hypothetical protein